MSNFFTSDWHLGDDRMQILGRPFESGEEMIEHLVTQHNRMVKPEDTVYMLGGRVIPGKADPSMIARFNGRIILFRGNYDTLPDQDYLPDVGGSSRKARAWR